jgi:hypothetical protein
LIVDQIEKRIKIKDKREKMNEGKGL